jgi:hypothetical protein
MNVVRGEQVKPSYAHRIGTTAYLADDIRRTRSSRSGSNEHRLLRNGQILHCVLEGVIITIAILFLVFFRLTRTGVLVVRRLVLKIKLRNTTVVRMVGQALLNKVTHWIVNDANYEATARTCRDVFVIRKLFARNLEAVAARTRVVEHSLLFVPGHVLNFDLVVIGTHRYALVSLVVTGDPSHL